MSELELVKLLTPPPESFVLVTLALWVVFLAVRRHALEARIDARRAELAQLMTHLTHKGRRNSEAFAIAKTFSALEPALQPGLFCVLTFAIAGRGHRRRATASSTAVRLEQDDPHIRQRVVGIVMNILICKSVLLWSVVRVVTVLGITLRMTDRVGRYSATFVGQLWDTVRPQDQVLSHG